MQYGDGMVVSRQQWVDVRQAGAQQTIQLALDGLEDGQVVEQEQEITIFAEPSSGASGSRASSSRDSKAMVSRTSGAVGRESPRPRRRLDSRDSVR